MAFAALKRFAARGTAALPAHQGGLAVAAALLIASTGTSTAQEAIINREFSNATVMGQADIGIRNGSVVIAPIPFSNPLLEHGLTLGAGYLFNLPGSKPSGAGIAALKTSNGSEGIGGGFNLNFADGLWSVGLIGGEATLFYDFPLSNTADLPLKQTGKLYTFTVSRAVNSKLSAGMSLAYLDSTLGVDVPDFEDLPPILTPDADVTVGKISIHAAYDTRDDTFFPTQGTLIKGSLAYGKELDAIFDGEIPVIDRHYSKGVASASRYARFGEEGILAANASICGASDSAPFFDGCGVGMANGLRGFGTLDDLASWSAGLQVEYRGRLTERIGYVGFAGLGIGGDTFADMSLDQGGFAAGFGVRYRISKQFGLDYAIDYARNDAQQEFLYITLGQRF